MVFLCVSALCERLIHLGTIERQTPMPWACLVGGDLGFVLQRQADVVQAVEQAVAAESVDLELRVKPYSSVSVRFCRSTVSW